MSLLCPTKVRSHLQLRSTNEAANDAMRERCDTIEVPPTVCPLRLPVQDGNLSASIVAYLHTGHALLRGSRREDANGVPDTPLAELIQRADMLREARIKSQTAVQMDCFPAGCCIGEGVNPDPRSVEWKCDAGSKRQFRGSEWGYPSSRGKSDLEDEQVCEDDG